MIDTIADMLTRIRNAQQVRKPDVTLPYSKMKHSVADILAQTGYVGTVEEVRGSGHPELRIALKYDAKKQPVIRSIRRVSTSGRRVYVDARHIPYVYDNLGIAILSTSQGLMTNKQARSKKVGGEVICEIF